MKRRGQNLIEFIVVIPLLVLILFGIVELSMFWRTAQTAQSIALEAASAAAAQIVIDGSNPNPAVEKAVDVVDKRLGALGVENVALHLQDIGDEFGIRPYAFYVYQSEETRSTNNGVYPLIEFTIDYRDPFKSGIITQLTYQYRTILLGAEFTLPGGRKVVIIPKDIPVSSTKIQQYNSY